MSSTCGVPSKCFGEMDYFIAEVRILGPKTLNKRQDVA